MNDTETTTLRDTLARHTRKGDLSIAMENGWVRCVACGHRCKIGPGRDGICKVRFNKDGALYVPFGYVGSLQVDPIEKKPFFHVLPGSQTLSFGMLGCDYHCAYCQNWFTSQSIRDPNAAAEPEEMAAEELVLLALKHEAPVLTSTYNEPLITSEWAVEVFRLARTHGIRCAYVSNGNGTPEVLEYIRPYVDFYKIDLKSFRQKNYQQLGGKLENVLDTVRTIRKMGIWLEVVTLVVPGFNDTDEELHDIARFLKSVSPDIPWHVTAFHQDYRMTDPENTSSSALVRAAEIGKNEGLRFVYAGNLAGQLATLENTYCPSCNALLVERHGFRVLSTTIVDGSCPQCRTAIPGVWS
jgi:pyruvate formate lyase activating enzyme